MIIPSNLVILLCGNRGAGKDTMFRHLHILDSRCRRYAYADALKSDLRQLCITQFGIDPLTATGQDKEFIRPLLIAFGCMWRDRDIDHWVSKVADQIEEQRAKNPQPTVHVTADGRFENELALYRKRFGNDCRIIWLERSDGPAPTEEEKKHEAAVKAASDHHVFWGFNDESQQLAVAQKLAEWLQKPYTPKTHP